MHLTSMTKAKKRAIRGIEKTLRALVAILDTIDIQLQNYDQSYHFHFLLKLMDYLEVRMQYNLAFVVYNDGPF